MAKTAAPEFKLPEFKLPELKLPKVDLEAVFALQAANLAAAHEAQTILLDAAQAIAKVQHGYVQELVATFKDGLSGKTPKAPEAALAEVKAAAAKAMAVTKEELDLGLLAQRRVADLVAQRVQANVNEIKALAA
jgi:hypothetical protein